MFRQNVADKAASVVANIWDTYDILFGSTLSMLLVQCSAGPPSFVHTKLHMKIKESYCVN